MVYYVHIYCYMYTNVYEHLCVYTCVMYMYIHCILESEWDMKSLSPITVSKVPEYSVFHKGNNAVIRSTDNAYSTCLHKVVLELLPQTKAKYDTHQKNNQHSMLKQANLLFNRGERDLNTIMHCCDKDC